MHQLINDFAESPIASFFACVFMVSALQTIVNGIVMIIASLTNKNNKK